MILPDLQQVFTQKLQGLYTNAERRFLWKLACEHYFEWAFSEPMPTSIHGIQPELVRGFMNAITELEKGTPWAYVFGETEFYGLKLKINSNVLIPRPETEELVELCLIQLKKEGIHSAKIIDIGTGSGCIAVSLAKANPNFALTACDFSEKALVLAQENAQKHNVAMQFLHCDYLNHSLTEVYDVFISNPPYIGTYESHEIANSVKCYEPNAALFAPKNNVLAFYEKIATDIMIQKHSPTFVFVEINQKLGLETLAVFQKTLKKAFLVKDLSGNNRFIWGKT